MAGRGARSPAGNHILAGLAGLTIVLFGLIALVVVWQFRPNTEFAAHPHADSRPRFDSPPTSLDIRTARVSGGVGSGDWMAWLADNPQCSERGDTEELARLHLGLAAQLAMRPECHPQLAGAAPALPPPPDWYADPRHELGNYGLRWWDGAEWTLFVWSLDSGPPPEHP